MRINKFSIVLQKIERSVCLRISKSKQSKNKLNKKELTEAYFRKPSCWVETLLHLIIRTWVIFSQQNKLQDLLHQAYSLLNCLSLSLTLPASCCRITTHKIILPQDSLRGQLLLLLKLYSNLKRVFLIAQHFSNMKMN